jgi:dTDP-glucose pyrophosphorylase
MIDASLFDKIKNRIVEIDSTLLLCMKQMDTEGIKLLMVFDDNKFIGILTLGDIQRSIIKKVALSDSISNIIDRNKLYGLPSDTLAEIKSKMFAIRAECVPVVDKQGNLIDVYFWNDLFADNEVVDARKKLDLPVVVMAGGKGQRLQPLTNVIPKPLIPLDEKTIIEIIMDQFEAIGCSRFYISVNYKAEIIKYYLDNIPHKYNINFFKEDKPLGTIGSVSLLKDKITTPFFVTNCDIIIEQDYRDVYDYHISNKNDITIVTAIKSYSIPYGVIETGDNGMMIELNEKPEISYMINTGVYILQPELINEIPQNEFFHITHLIEKIRQQGGKIGCFPISEKSLTDIGQWDEYLKLIKK